MPAPTKAEIDAFLDRLTDPKDREIVMGLLGLLVAAQTQAAFHARVAGALEQIAGRIGMNTTAAALALGTAAQAATAAGAASLARVHKAYDEANRAVSAGMGAAEEFIKIYRNDEKASGGVGPATGGQVFKEVAGALLSVALPGASSLFRIISG
jgi:hypothetical protein